MNLTDAIPTTIAALNGFAAHCAGLPETRAFPEEFRTYEITGVVQLTRVEDDRDIHVVVADPANTGDTMIVEVVDPLCSGAAQSPYLPILTQAKAQYTSLGNLVGKQVKMRGVGFFDFDHGQTGRSRSCIELHPVTNIVLAP